MEGHPRSAEDLAAAAGGSVTELVRALLSEAELKAASIVEAAATEAEQARAEGAAEAARLTEAALAAAQAVLQRISAIEERLGVVVAELRKDALALPAGPERLAEITPDESLPPSAVPGAAFDVGQLAANLRSILEGPPPARPREDPPERPAQ